VPESENPEDAGYFFFFFTAIALKRKPPRSLTVSVGSPHILDKKNQCITARRKLFGRERQRFLVLIGIT
jgi:hypothetical protein